MAVISRNLIDEYDGDGFAAQYSKYAVNAKNDENGNQIHTTYAAKTELSGKVDKVEGKGLSTNDYSATDKTKVDSYPSLPQSSSGKFLKDDGTWGTPSSGAELPDPSADNSLLTGSQDGSIAWQTLGKSYFGSTVTDDSGDTITDDNGEPLTDDNGTELFSSFNGIGFGAERAIADAAGNEIETTYATKSEVSAAISRIESVASARTDASGNDIETTYATKQELTGYATSNDVSTINETINSLDETYATKEELNTALGNIETLLDAL